MSEYVYRRANEVLWITDGRKQQKIRRPTPLIEILEGRQLKHLGHVLREERQNPLYQSASRRNLLRPEKQNSVGLPAPRQHPMWKRRPRS